MDNKEKSNENEITKTLDSKEAASEEQNQNPSEEIIITPTEISDAPEQIEKKRDLSAIIPKFVDNEENEGAVELVSKDNQLKGDGAVSLGTINSDGEVTVNNEAVLPEQIDIEQRKIETQRNKNNKKKKEKKKNSKAAQKIQNTTALISLIIIVALGGFAYYIFNRPTEDDFQPLPVTVELGESLPIRTSAYVKPGIGKDVEELLYTLDLSKVNESQVGEYEFSVTYNNIKKIGKLKIQDTTPPDLVVRELIISEGTTYNAASFMESCIDLSGCELSFQDASTPTKYTSPGSYVVYIVATDPFNNATTKQASLIIEAEGNLRTYVREVPFNTASGYEAVEYYSLRFRQNQSDSILITGTHTTEYIYHDNDKYQKAQNDYAGEVGYSFDAAKLTVRKTESNLTYIGSNYSRLSDIERYLINEDFSLQQ